MMDQDGNTPKDKARQLVDRLMKPLKDGDKPQVELGELPARQCAMICCDAIINYEFFGSHTQRYWVKVKEQIQKMQ